MESINILSQSNAIIITLLISVVFLVIGIIYSRNSSDLKNYLVANRSIGTFSLSASFISSALGSWILFGPSSAATWGGIGAVIGYSLGTAFPLFFLIHLGKEFRTQYPKGQTLFEVINLKLGNDLFRLILLLSFFYMTIFLIAEVTAVSILIRYLSGTDLWVTSLIILSCSLIYTLYGGLRASIITDNIQFFMFSIILLISFFYLIYLKAIPFNISFIRETRPELLSINYTSNFTSGLTFFIAVAATNLFHQGNWQRVYAAKTDNVLKKSLIVSFIFIVPVVFIMGFSGLVSVSIDSGVLPDLAFFALLFKEGNLYFLSSIIIFLAISLTISTIDTIINAISSLVIVDGNKFIKVKGDFIKLSKLIMIFLCIITFIIASKGFSILYLFLLADLFCCAAVLSIFYNFYKKPLNQKNIYMSIILGLVGGLLFFPSPDFSKSILVGVLIPSSFFPELITNSLLFWSFLMSTFLPILFWKVNLKK